MNNPIQITVQCADAQEALSVLSQLSEGEPPKAATARKAPARKTKRKGAKKKTRRAAPPPEPEEPEVSIEDLQLALQAKMSRDGPDSIRELFAEFGVAKLSQLDPANYAEMLDNLQEE